MTYTETSPVGEIAAESPATIKVFQRHGIDFCCGGGRPLGSVCAERGLAVADVLAELADAKSGPGQPSLVGAGAGELLGHILARYHRPLWEDLPRLGEMSAKVLNAHGERHPEMVPEMHRLFVELRSALEPHLQQEEDVLFPGILRLVGRAAAGRRPGASELVDPVEKELAEMTAEHEAVGALLARLRSVTSGYTAPADACNTFRGLLYGLDELEREIHEHVHLENNVLAPMVRKAIASLPAAVNPAR